ncbi:hypothetical protein QBC35DRAFT_27039 [Podospora australis]|uniref:Cell division cycle protein 123 n=1 Tax=Podospora australis TaxID=1536484 RepID=A0AAN6X116_9PEZI|nr:hypothetical protein QBC35DRAFT_27039 [Podospora australis]
MKLVKINLDIIRNHVQRDRYMGQPVPFNSSLNSESEASDLQRPDTDASYSFKRWLPLILRTREKDALQTISLNRSQARLLLEAAEGSITSWFGINDVYREGLEEEIYPLLNPLKFPPEGLFMRLDACSPKDGSSVEGDVALHTVHAIVLRIVTSTMARDALLHSLNRGDQQVELFFLPFQERVGCLRVFCKPGDDNQITGISQYCWGSLGKFQELENEKLLDTVVEKVVVAAGKVRNMILEEVRGTEKAVAVAENDALMLRQGFSFDLFYDEVKDAISLVELNTFGVSSDSESCLFHWALDRGVLYGEEEAQFRVAIHMKGFYGKPSREKVRVTNLGDTTGRIMRFEREDWRSWLKIID